MTLNSKYFFWTIIFVVSILFIKLVSSIIAPFIVSILIAYLLDPLTIKLEKFGVKRYLTVFIIVTIFFSIVLIALYKLAPIFLEQIQQFIYNVPKYEDLVTKKLLELGDIFPEINSKIAHNFKSQLSSLTNQIFHYLTLIIKEVFNSSVAILNIIALIFFTPILVFYILRDWPKLVVTFNKLLPLKYKDVILEQLKQIDTILSAYIRGQLMACFILALFYVISLNIIGLNYHLLVGILSGILTVIPYFGLIIGAIICTIVSYLQSSSIEYTLLTLGIFIAGHLVEFYVIIPKLIGDKVGLHPVWVLFALLAGGAIFGFWGVFFAIPIAAILGAILRSLVKIYYASKMYKK